jgi:hypothetical protein
MKKKKPTLFNLQSHIMMKTTSWVGGWMCWQCRESLLSGCLEGGVRSCGDDGDPVLIGADMNAGVD